MSWKKGDLGRFKSEDPSNPRFEVLCWDTTQNVVRIWYNGEKSPTEIPFLTFKNECVNWWTSAVIPDVPAWLKENIYFSFKGQVVQAKVLPGTLDSPSLRFRDTPRSKPPAKQEKFIRIEGELLLRSIRRDYASCLTVEGLLALVPLSQIAKEGFVRVSAWDMISADSDVLDEPDEDALIEALRGV